VGPRATEILQIAGCVYVPISRSIIRIRSRAHGNTYTFGQFHWREGAVPRRAAPRRPQRHRRILVFRFRSRDAFFLCSRYPLISGPRRSTAHRHTAPFCFRIFVLPVVQARSRSSSSSRPAFSSPGSEPARGPSRTARTSQDLFARGYAQTYAYVSRRYVRNGAHFAGMPLNESSCTCLSCRAAPVPLCRNRFPEGAQIREVICERKSAKA